MVQLMLYVLVCGCMVVCDDGATWPMQCGKSLASVAYVVEHMHFV